MKTSILVALLVLIGIMWGSTVPFTKMAVATGHNPLGLIFWQLLIAALCLYPVARIRKSHLPWDGPSLRLYAVVALLGTIFPNAFSYWAAFHLPGGVMALTIATVPVFTLVIALAIGSEKLDMKRVLGLSLGLAAVALLVLPDSSLPDPSKAIFVFVALVAPFAYGVEANYLARASLPTVGPIATLLGASILGTVISLPLAVVVDGFVNPVASFGKAETALIISSVLHVLAYSGYIWLIGQAGAVFSAQVAYIVTPAGVALSALLLGETPSLWLLVALVLMLIALSLVQPRQEEVVVKSVVPDLPEDDQFDR